MALYKVINRFIQRKYSTVGASVRVRFAPSPTGYLHLGGLRTALYNYLFAKSRNGTFILRVEDTDQKRLIKGAQEKLVDDLLWCGLKIDEGVGSSRDRVVAENFTSYVQSQRLNIYRSEMKKLLRNGSAYRCFCNSTRLDVLRREATRAGQVPKYDNKCRHLSPAQIQENLSNKKEFSIRLKLLGEIHSFDDLIYGKISYDLLNEGDPIIMKSDGYPTYHFANVVDDHLMEITHVLRGVEWQISTIKHILLYRAFGWTPPAFGHLPLLMNNDGTKLSKRQGDITIEHYRNAGIFPEALINFVTFSGGGFNRDSSIKLLSMNDLVELFRLERINAHSTKIFPNKLLEYNRLALKQRLITSSQKQELIETVRRLTRQTFGLDNRLQLQLDDEHIIKILNWAQDRINTLQDLRSEQFAFLWAVPSKIDFPDDKYRHFLVNLQDNLHKSNLNMSKKDLATMLRQTTSDLDLNFQLAMKFLRLVLTGLQNGPSVAEIIEVLGKDTTVDRLRRPLAK